MDEQKSADNATALLTEQSPTETQGVEEVQPSPLLQMLLEQHAARDRPTLPSRIEGIVVGTVARVDDEGAVWVRFPGTPEDGVPARSMMALSGDDVGRTVAIMFEASDSSRPLVTGPIVTPSIQPDGEPYTTYSDGRRVEISAVDEIVLRCGKSSITLTREGKIELRGEYVLSRSSGVNRIQGGAVEVN